jgi:CheY-like chemotaxis protein
MARVDLLLTDVVMPQLTGPELAEALRQRRPGVPVLYMSGYTANAVAQEGVRDASVRLLQKPFTNDSLARAIRGALDEEPDLRILIPMP